MESSILLNLSNHPYATWDEPQRQAALRFGDRVEDYPFPIVDPKMSEAEVVRLADEIAADVASLYPNLKYIHLMGEMTLCAALLRRFHAKNIVCVASTTERIANPLPGGGVEKIFRFCRFRMYSDESSATDELPVTKEEPDKNDEDIRTAEPVQRKEIVLTPSQQQAFDSIKTFIEDPMSKVFILKGYAGTGKTTLMRKLVAEMNARKVEYSLLASTGRAAKILANATGHTTRTIHSKIYKFTDLNQDLAKVAALQEEKKSDSIGQLYLNFEMTPVERPMPGHPHYYIVDEASMVSDEVDKNAIQAIFGSGKLLSDLFRYDNGGKFIFVGDICQLPPVTQPVSPALSPRYIEETFGLKSYESVLTEVVRQAADNDITAASQKIRKLYYSPSSEPWAKFPLRGYRDIHIYNSQAVLLSEYIKRIQTEGFNSATLLCSSNRQCDTITQIVRPAFGHKAKSLEKGDLLLVTQNNLLSGLMNGDLVTVEDVQFYERRAGMTFLNVSVKELFSGQVVSQLMIADIIYSNQTNISQTQQRELFIDFYYRMKNQGIKQKSPAFNQQMKDDPYLNAIRAVYGYALTCHKAQGGEWDYVYLDIPRSVPALPKPYVYQWVYTAMTRARKGLYIVNDFWVV